MKEVTWFSSSDTVITGNFRGNTIQVGPTCGTSKSFTLDLGRITTAMVSCISFEGTISRPSSFVCKIQKVGSQANSSLGELQLTALARALEQGNFSLAAAASAHCFGSSSGARKLLTCGCSCNSLL
ncbi:hypothetical protein ElyMa_002915400 [Elysia marginata]|uniref:Uncharacterized protein n=1 Tax=Elysia marginata TaxID=1093978 RepID=A0AAV4I3Z3_9GAST|nr:hypothetical protein ElyMa_002915400 [Elysia marginata]